MSNRSLRSWRRSVEHVPRRLEPAARDDDQLVERLVAAQAVGRPAFDDPGDEAPWAARRAVR